MTQAMLNQLVSLATGETRTTVDRLGFSCADPLSVHHDPEPCDASDLDRYLDWDAVQSQRQVALP